MSAKQDQQVLVIDGFLQHAGGWQLANRLAKEGFDGVTERECEQNWGGVNEACLDDVSKAKDVVVYSWGCATAWHTTANWQHPADFLVPRKRKLIVVAGVMCPFFGQFGQWLAPTNIFEQCINLQPTHAFPISEPFKPDNGWWNFGQPELETALVDRDLLTNKLVHPVINVNVDGLFAPFTDGVTIHTTVMNHPQVLDFIVKQLSKGL